MTINNLDVLMSLDPLELSKQDIDDIIAYQRKAKANFEAGIKPKKGEGAAKVDLSQIITNLTGGAVAKPTKIERRF